ncbi:MAG: type I glutamate--ammonia ligase [Micavibrio aeruginosavorus]|uniref:Glutamine synthetase n=1 Tax=Micavibrio aeruginosavorus TaxID=349221 RepID=A0A2W5FLU0_9BACT|nr:MAG: type I glutamate--ammonia ligase [Micavibrio aeruginosavorus]
MSSSSVPKFKNANEFIKFIKDNDYQYVDFIFCDIRGKQQHCDMHWSVIDEDMINVGAFFDGSSISGWKAINESDMILKPDLDKVVIDPFSAQAKVKIFCDVIEPNTNDNYGRCPRSIAKKAEAHIKTIGLADNAFFGPEAEFFVFDDVRYSVSMNKVSYEFDSSESPHNTDKKIEGGNLAHRPRVKGGYFPDAPLDTGADLRAEMLTVLSNMGVPVEKHHHEVAPAQHELGVKFGTLVESADNMILYKYAVHNVAAAYGKTATFMPKPVFGDNGSGMHVHQSLWKDGKPLFAGDLYAGLSENCLYYIGGIIKHAQALNALTNPTTNSYKRLVPGYEAPVLLAYSSRNRSASCRIPYSISPKGKRVEVRFPDPTANPYLAFSAMLMAGLDGIKNKIHPGEAMDMNLYDLSPAELMKVPNVCGSLRQALNALAIDHDFLLEGGVFTKDFVESYIELRMEEVLAFETMPHPIEYDMYYSS